MNTFNTKAKVKNQVSKLCQETGHFIIIHRNEMFICKPYEDVTMPVIDQLLVSVKDQIATHPISGGNDGFDFVKVIVL